jgi:NAD(P)-dependent dehydrogenase (short-subunit alcohol dehydrogenase family)
MTSLAGRVAIVTGGSREIGTAMAAALLEAGAAVVLSHHGAPELAAELAARRVDAADRLLLVDADVTQVSENRRLVACAVEAFGRVDIFAANAGITVWGPFLEVEESTWHSVIDLNLKGSFFGAQAAARQMAAQRTADPADSYGGRIVFSSSITGGAVFPNCSPYAVSKAGLRHMAAVLADELGGYGITVNALGIGATLNERNLRDDPLYAEHWAAVIPSGRCGAPEDVASALLYLVSPAAQMVNGHTLMIDGGWSALGRVPQ